MTTIFYKGVYTFKGMIDPDDFILPEAGMKVRLEVNIGYCAKCRKFMNKISGNFFIEGKRYIKYVCENCDITYKEFVKLKDEFR